MRSGGKAATAVTLVLTLAVAPAAAGARTTSADGTAAPSAATAKAKPRFLTAKQWPTDDTYFVWTPNGGGKGYVYPLLSCADEVLPKAHTSYKGVRGQKYAYGLQHIATLRSKQAAAKMTTRYVNYLRACNSESAKRKTFPQTIEVLGRYPKVGDGLVVVAVYTTNPKPESIDWPHYMYLYGVGHNGAVFTAVELHREGLPADAPVAAFTAMSKTAVRQLAP